MAVFSKTGGSNGGSYAEYFTAKLTVIEESYSVENNTSTVSWKLKLISGDSGKFSDYYGYFDVYINGKHVLDDEGYKSITSANTSITLGSGTLTVEHDDDGEKTIACSATIDMASGTYSPGDFSLSGNLELTDILRYATANQSLKTKTSSSISINWSSDSTIDYIWYSKDNGSTWTGINVTDGTSGSYTISSLSANTTYKIKTRVRRKDSQLTTDSSVLSVTTYKKTTPTISLSSKTVNSITVSSGCNVTVSSTKYRIKISGGSYGSYQISPTFTGLSPNTSYVIQVYKVGKDSGEAGTATLSVKTYDIARLTVYPNFNLGDDVTIQFTNPSGATVQVGLYDSKGVNDYALYRTISGTNYTFKFTDEELDKMYKALENNNSLSARFYINTSNNAYREYKAITISLTGNQKTAHVGNNGIKRAKVFIGKEGVKRCVVWTGVNGTARRCI